MQQKRKKLMIYSITLLFPRMPLEKKQKIHRLSTDNRAGSLLLFGLNKMVTAVVLTVFGVWREHRRNPVEHYGFDLKHLNIR